MLFEHPFRGSPEEYHRVFGCDVLFGEPRNALAVSAELMRLTCSGKDDEDGA
jgi:hypothetical protein